MQTLRKGKEMVKIQYKKIESNIWYSEYTIYNAKSDLLSEVKKLDTVTSYVGKPIDYDIACEIVNKLLDDKEQLKKRA